MHPWFLILLLIFVPPLLAEQAKIAIILDDIGYSKKLGKIALTLDDNIAYAILPHTPYGKFFAKQLHQQGREILLHLPMQTMRPSTEDKGLLKDTMNFGTFSQQLQNNFNAIPYFTGINNHRGSRLTSNKNAMIVLMDFIKKQPQSYFFIDSRTHGKSVAYKMAQLFKIPSASRDIFLDNNLADEKIQQQFNRLIRLAKRKGSAIAIGHPHRSTLRVLKKNLALLKQLNIELVRPSQLLK